MPAKNDVTGDFIQSKTNSNTYRDNWDKIFAKKPISVGVEQGSDVNRKITVKYEYFDDAVEIFENIMGISFDNINRSDDLVVYELIVAITCNDYIQESDMLMLTYMKELVLYYLADKDHDKFNEFYNNWIRKYTVS